MPRRADAPTMNAIEKWLCLLLAGALNLAAAEKPADKTLPVRGFCIPAPAANRVDEFIKFIAGNRAFAARVAKEADIKPQ